jgi:amino acid transporter
MEDQDHKKLGQFLSTAICGNDILSSVLYVAAIAIVFSGVYAPIVLMLVALVLFFYRTVYREVVEALPVNGGAYNALLNGTSKTIAATAGSMTILSYTATAVISAKTAVEYLFQFIEQIFSQNHIGISASQVESFVIPLVLIIMLFFAVLVISGIKDSARVALVIFATHIFVLITFIAVAIIFISAHGFGMFHQNVLATNTLIANNGGLIKTIFLGFSAALLGVSGFESSANFVEEQQKGVFKYTLRNMLIGIIVFNPITAFVVLNILSLKGIISAQNSLIAVAAHPIGGIILVGIIAVDAFLVLCGAVLTAFIGVSGLVNRMTLDEVLPSFLIKENKKHAHPRIVIAFFLLCSSILLITRGNLLSIAGVYTISFLGVMSLFAFGNLLLRQTRRDLKRSYNAPFIFVILALFATSAGIIGNILINKTNVVFFLIYFIPTILIVFSLIYRSDVLKMVIRLFEPFPPLRRVFERLYVRTTTSEFYVFIHHAHKLYRTLDYISKNENGRNVTIVHCSHGDDGEKKDIDELVGMLKRAGAFTDFNIKFMYEEGGFGPETIDKFATENNIAKNKIFIGSIHDYHSFSYDELGGVRIIS